MKKRLSAYNRKRDFSVTPEPSGDIRRRAQKTHKIFVIQKHAARRLHYDLRLEDGGVLKSWAVPKGPSTDPADKRLAIMTEDHPMEYAKFEGMIPRGEYGGGKVIVWDRGTYIHLTRRKGKFISLEKAVEQGKVLFWLEGKKLRGGFALVRMKDKDWLLRNIKNAPEMEGGQPVETRPESIVSGKLVEEIAA